MACPFFRIELLPARQGDAIWIEYGKSDRTRRILIDGGPIGTYNELENKFKSLEAGDQRVELVVITHVDTDHIEGIVRLFAEKKNKWPILPQDIWFNGYRHMKETGVLGGREGDFLSALIFDRAYEYWNKGFGRKAVMVMPDQPLPSEILEEGMKYTILSPDQNKLKKMAKKWKKDVEKHDLKPGDLEAAMEQFLQKKRYHPDDGILGGPGEIDQWLQDQLKTDSSAANGSSIAFLLEFECNSCLFLGDAHADIVSESISRLLQPNVERLKVDAVKVSHHGSRANINQELMNLIDARHFLVSSDGSYHEHPDPEAIEAIIQGSLQDPTIWFNYRSDYTTPWEPENNKHLRTYFVRYPKKGKEGIGFDLFNL